MKYSRRMLVSVFWVLLGAVLVVCCSAGLIKDDYWSGLGCGFIGVGVVQLIRHIRYRADEAYREKVDVEISDERNKYLSSKAWAWAGYLYVMVAAISSLLLKLAGREELMFMAAGSVCLIMLLYWGCWMYLRKKY